MSDIPSQASIPDSITSSPMPGVVFESKQLAPSELSNVLLLTESQLTSCLVEQPVSLG